MAVDSADEAGSLRREIDHDATRRPPDGEHPARAPAPAVVAPADAGSAEAPKAARPTLPWRVALFLWASAFICLLAYELLTALVRSLFLVK